MDRRDEQKRRGLATNSIFGVAAWFLPLALGFISTPIIVHSLGVEQYGVYAIVLGFLSYSFTFGIGRVAAKYVAEFNAAGQKDNAARAVIATFFFTILIAAVGAGVLIALTPWIISDVLLLPDEFVEPATIALYIAIAAGVATMLSQVFQSTLQGLHRFGTYLGISTTFSILLTGGNILIAKSGHGLVALIGWNLFTTITSAIVFYFFAVTGLKDFRPTVHIGKDLIYAVATYGLSIILYQIFGNLLFIFERAWIVRNHGPEELTFFFVPMLLGIYLHGFISSFSLALFPRLNELLTDRGQMEMLYQKATAVVFSIAVMGVVTLIVSGRTFLGTWVGTEFALRSYPMLVIHSITFGLIALFVVVWALSETYKAPSFNVLITFVWLITAVFIVLAAGSETGSITVAAARLIGVVVTVPMILYLEHRFLGRIQLKFWLRTVFFVTLASAALSAIQSVALRAFPKDWIGLIAGMAVGGAVYVSLLIFTGILERTQIDAILKKILGENRYQPE
ncbi:hypothetical protein [Leptolyngbya sp. 7M]|uniref:hypothetical protein n=1 Tax=Leptolyngbya sp. 7M TaxID=2812896 RepID=UPI001B8A995A|nr:hypothetical protein [Leptolyngbya sp. 7M]QYO66178.1 hypothetical protein JVX88_05090 [Leptolyngbya sp. 7M]